MKWILALVSPAVILLASTGSTVADEQDLATGHPRPSYENVADIDAMEAALRKSLAEHERYSFSRGCAWWQTERHRIILYLHDDREVKFGSKMQTNSQDIRGETVTAFAYKSVSAMEPAFFLSVLVPYVPDGRPAKVARTIKTRVDKSGNGTAAIGDVGVSINTDGTWSVARSIAQ
ncbi:MAG: hypothetical protein HQ567_30205 [Candidatus Nealsonbacteria bacterium]|nr:hypothetical protein [Candidatus Nealsonbacteria bacterium]